MNALWGPVLGFEGMYEVSSDGRIRSVERTVRCGRGRGHERVVRAKEIYQHTSYRNGIPYKHVTLWNQGKGSTRWVHRVVLEAFVGPRPSGMFGCHNNSVSTDNRVENLRWDTPKSNSADRDALGRGSRGERNPRSRLSEEQVLAVRASAKSARSLAAELRVSRETIFQIRSRKTWAHLSP